MADGFDSLVRMPNSRFQLEDFDHIEPSARHWLVKGLWPSVGLAFLAGPSMSGKSFWALDTLARIARGVPVLGLRTMQCGVVYVAAESAAGARLRVAGLRSQIGALGGAFDFIGQAPNLTDPQDVLNLKAALIEAQEKQAALGIRLGAVCIDTMSAALPGADENGSKDMSPVLAALQALAVELGVLILVIAHTGKDENRGLRGWSGLVANADGVITLESPQGDTRSGTVTKVKDGVSGVRFAFSLRQVLLAPDDDGDEVTTCVVDAAEAPLPADRRKLRLSAKQQLVLRAVELCLSEGLGEQVTPPAGIPAGKLAVHRERVKERARAEGYADDDAKPETVRRKLNCHLTDLIGKERLRAQGDYLWLL